MSSIMREDWEEIELGDVCDFVGGGTPSKRESSYWNGKIPWASIKDIKGDELHKTLDFITEEGLSKSASNLARIGEIILATRINPGKPILSKIDAAINQDLKIVKPKIKIDTKYLFYGFKTLERKVIQISSGTTVLGINLSNLRSIDFGICPLPEQRAIVAKIEELFSDLDKGIADLKKAQDQLLIFRQAVLKKAFEGEYPQKKIIEIADVNTGATPKRGNSEFWENGTIPWVTSTVVNNDFVNEPSELITKNAIKQTNCKLIPKGSLLVAMYGEGKTRGKCSELNIDTTTNQALAGITLFEENKESKQFVKWFFVKNYEEIRMLSSGGVQPNLNLSIIKNTKIPFPHPEEQHQIVRKIESRLSVCDKVEQSITESLEKAKALRQSILKKAFEGALLSQAEIAACKAEPDYEPASVLLERIKKESK
jgi:type I restriction enzyme S subunit